MAIFKLSGFADEADKALTGQIEALKQASISQVELRGVNGKNVSELTLDEANEAAALLAANGIGVSALGSPYGKYPITEDFEPHYNQFMHGLELAKVFGSDCIRMFSFFIPQDQDPSAYRDEVMKRLDKMANAAAKNGLQLLHENEKGIYGDTDDRCLDILETFSGRILGVFDPANFIQCHVVPGDAIEKLKDYIAYMHIKDALLADGSVVPCGYGDGSIAKLLTIISKRALGVTLSLEPHLKVFDGLSNLQDEEVKHKFEYKDSRTAFTAAADAIKTILTEIGFNEIEGRNGTWMK